MADTWFRDLMLPQSSQLYHQASSIGTAMKEYDTAYAALRNFVNQGRQQAIDRSYDELARTGQLNSTSIAKAVGIINMNAEQELTNARAMAEMERASARARKAELGQMAKSATVSDVVNLGKQAAGAALIAGGMGAFGGGGAAATATGASTAANAVPVGAGGIAANATYQSAGQMMGIPSIAGINATNTAASAAANASRYTPWMAAVGENLAGIQGSPFSQAATRNKYPGMLDYANLYKQATPSYTSGGEPQMTLDDYYRKLGWPPPSGR